MNQQEYHYYAFISYDTSDSKWAKWLERNLSHYHIPTSIKKNKIGIPDKLRPIFIYEYDLAGNQLHDALQRELDASKYLIVICSRESAKSKYVNDEIQHFIDTGRTDAIIPFIVDGEVKSENPDMECFAPALLSLMNEKESELRGTNIATNGKRGALVDVVATMLNLRRDSLWNRYVMRRLKQRMAVGLAILSVMITLIAYWLYSRPTYEYYADYVDWWGMPKGVIKLDEKQIKTRSGIYKFEYRRVPFGVPNPYSYGNRRVVRVEHINPAGTIVDIEQTEFFNRYPIQKISYSNTTGRVVGVTYCANNEKEIMRYRITDYEGNIASLVDIENVVDGGGVNHARSNSTISSLIEEEQSNAKITRYFYARNDEGYIEAQRYHRNNDRLEESIVQDAMGVAALVYDLDSLGRHKRIYYSDGEKLHAVKRGVAIREYEYDEYGNICLVRCLNKEEQPVINESGWAVGVSVANEYGNTIEEYYLDTEGKPCFAVESGYHRATLSYDERNFRREVCYWDTEGNLCEGAEGAARVVIDTDNKGRMVGMQTFDVEGNPCCSELGAPRVVFKYDGNNVAEITYFDGNGEPCCCKGGYAKSCHEYDSETNNLVKMSYYGVDGKPTLSNDGFAGAVFLYEDDEVRASVRLGVDENPRDGSDGSAISYFEYDDRGNVTVTSYFDSNNSPTNVTGGYALLQSVYNDRGLKEFVATYSADTLLCVDSELCAITKYEYDDSGNVVRLSFEDDQEMPCISSYGVASAVMEYDENQNMTSMEYYNELDNPMEKEGIFRTENSYNQRGETTEVRYYNINKRLLNFERYEYDIRGRVVSISYFNSQGKPYIKGSKAVKYYRKYDENDIVEAYYCDSKGAICRGPEGYAKVRYKYDLMGNTVETIFYDSLDSLQMNDIEGYAKVVKTYNERNLLTSESYYDDNGNPCKVNEGQWARVVLMYNDLGLEIERAFYDEKDSLVFVKDFGWAKVKYEYDERANLVSEEFFDQTNSLCLGDGGYAKVVCNYDDDNFPIEVIFYDANNNLTIPKETFFARRVVVFNQEGVGSATYYDEHNEVINLE